MATTGVKRAACILGAGSADTVTLSGGTSAAVKVTNGHATGTIYARTDGTAATVPAAGTAVEEFVVPPMQTRVLPNEVTGGAFSVSLISSTACPYEVSTS